MITRTLIVIFFLAIAGCTYHASSASVSKACPASGQRISLELSKATSKWIFSEHAGAFGNIVEQYSFIIPSVPAQRRVYVVQEIKLEDANSLMKDIPPLAAGEIVLDPQNKEAIVNIRTEGGGEFPGNGKYPMTYFSFDGADWPKAEVFAGSCGRTKSTG